MSMNKKFVYQVCNNKKVNKLYFRMEQKMLRDIDGSKDWSGRMFTEGN
jgi:hypothetical protein